MALYGELGGKVMSVIKNMFKLKIKTLLLLLVATIILIAWRKYSNGNKAIIVWWTKGFPGERNEELSCGQYSCLITSDKVQNVNAYLFYGSNLDFDNLPVPRHSETIWGLIHEESPRNVEILMHEKGLNLFNYSSTFSRYSNVPFVLQYLNNLEYLTSRKYFLPTKEKNKLLVEISPVLYLHSDCETMTERDDYVSELMNYFNVDSYGKCLNNKHLPRRFKTDYLNKLDEDEFLRFVSQYKFTVAIENGVCDDYITEKLWRPLSVGSVPLYYGSPTVSDWLPNKNSVIILDQYRSPKDLADYLNVLMKNDTLYEEYLDHKIKNKIENKRLIEEFNQTPHASDALEISKDFECYICKKLHESNEVPAIVDKQHYNCPEPKSLLLDSQSENSWLYSWSVARTQAEEVYNKVVNGKM